MGGRKRSAVPADLANASERFEAWRSRRKVGSRVPEPLWALAVKLASDHGLRRTASLLKIDFDSLKKRVDDEQARSHSPAAFLEVTPASLPAHGECVIELEDGAGGRMRVSLKGYDAPDLAALARSFWNDQ